MANELEFSFDDIEEIKGSWTFNAKACFILSDESWDCEPDGR